jgi:hypothetical protein
VSVAAEGPGGGCGGKGHTRWCRLPCDDVVHWVMHVYCCQVGRRGGGGGVGTSLLCTTMVVHTEKGPHIQPGMTMPAAHHGPCHLATRH